MNQSNLHSGKPGPRSADMSAIMDGSSLMAQAADLNLRLMKWRMWYVLCTYSVLTIVKYYGSNIMSYDFVLILVWCAIYAFSQVVNFLYCIER